MGKAAKCIEMLQILNSGRVYKVNELANLMDTNPRNIIEYKKELEECGYYITTLAGRYGGYQLNKSCIIPSLRFLPSEIKALDDGVDYLCTRNDFLNKKEFQKAIAKIYSMLTKDPYDNELSIINRFPLSMKEEDLRYRYNILNDAIISKKAVKLHYISQKNVEHEYIYHPYDLFMYNNAWFVLGWCEYFNDIINFKINRITSIEKINKPFEVAKFYNKSDYIDEFGFKSDNEWYHVEFIASGKNAAIVKDRIYGKNQVLESLDKDHTLVKVDMKTKGDILSFVLGFKTNIKVLQPDWLKDDLLSYAEFIEKLYKK